MRKKYNRILLFWFSGTGNALKACNWICEEAKKNNIQTSVYPISNNLEIKQDEIDDRTLIGFLAPTHGFSIAPAMLKFIFKFSSKIKPDVFVLNTRAGLKFSNIFFPGLSGAAQFLPMIILKLKSYRIVGGLPLDMPSNWLLVHPGLNSSAANAISDKCEGKTKLFINTLFNNKKVFRKMLVTLPIDIAIFPISFIYYFYGRFILAKTMIYTSNCNSCMICVNNCPVGAIKIIDKKPYWSYWCESCMRCINICPKVSIQTSHLILIISMIVPGYIFNQYILKYLNLPEIINYSYILSAIRMMITLFELFILYYLIQRFLKYRFFSNVFKYTSLSSYWRRYLAPGITVKDFEK